jgi:drug/metabolite transporter (DMT)-like permease
MRWSPYVALLTGTLFAATGQVAFKIGASGRESLAGFLNVWIAGGLVAYGLGTLLWIFALSKLPLTVVYPFTAFTFVLVYATGVLVLGEAATKTQILGVGLVLFGLFLITTGAGR